MGAQSYPNRYLKKKKALYSSRASRFRHRQLQWPSGLNTRLEVLQDGSQGGSSKSAIDILCVCVDLVVLPDPVLAIDLKKQTEINANK